MAAAHRSSRAETDFIEIWGHIAKDVRLQQIASSTGSMPPANCSQAIHMPVRAAMISRGLRFYPVGNCLIFYTPAEDGIAVARVLHGARDYPREFQ